MNRVHHTACPVCKSININPLLTVRDNSVSGEEFVIWQCSDCALRFTQDAPDETAIGAYYRSGDYISHSNTDKGFINKLYQRVRRITLRHKKELIIHHTNVDTGAILDVGAGVGAFLAEMKGAGWNITGIEPDEGAKAVAKNTYGLELNGPELLDQVPPATFDAITLWHVLEHVHPLHQYMDRLCALLKKDGCLFIALPNYQSFDNDTYKLYWAAYDVPRHLYHFAPASMEKLMSRHGLKITSKKPMWFDAFYISLLSSKYKNGKPNLPGAGITGLRSNGAALLNRDRCSSLIYIIQKV